MITTTCLKVAGGPVSVPHGPVAAAAFPGPLPEPPPRAATAIAATSAANASRRQPRTYPVNALPIRGFSQRLPSFNREELVNPHRSKVEATSRLVKLSGRTARHGTSDVVRTLLPLFGLGVSQWFAWADCPGDRARLDRRCGVSPSLCILPAVS